MSIGEDILDAEIDAAAALVRSILPVGVESLLQHGLAVKPETLKKSGYESLFPGVAGHVVTSTSSEPLWVIPPALCFHVFETLSSSQLQTADQSVFGLDGWCFRREAVTSSVRRPFYRVCETVYFGSAKSCSDWLDACATAILRSMPSRLQFEIVPASDSFGGGREAQILEYLQRWSDAKREVVCKVANGVALGSLNFHGTKFTRAFAISGPNGEELHSACVGFGLERLALALRFPTKAGGGASSN